jgi:hypothetical protein
MISPTSALRASALACLAASLGFSQGDPLVSKNLPYVFADKSGFWAFAADGVRFSRIDPSKDPLDIRDGELKIGAGIRGGLARSSTALLFYGYPSSDSSTVGGLAVLTHEGKTAVDTVIFARPAGKSNGITAGVEFSALAQWQDTVVIGAGRGGIAWAKAAPETRGVLASDSLKFSALPAGQDTAVAAIACPRNGACPVAQLSALADKNGEPDSVTALAVDSAADTTWLLIGSQTGLRRGRLGGNVFPAAHLPASKPGSIRIESIFADPAHALLWVFSGSEYFFSSDHGRTFHKPPRIAGLSVAPDSLGSTQTGTQPAAAFAGDSTFVNFNLTDPGLVVFRRDTLLANQGTGELADVLLDKADGLDIGSGEGRLTTLAALPGASGTTLLAGSTFKGVFLRRPGQAWLNVNSLKALKNGLQEIITYPTLFSGTTVDGQPEYVRVGYRLKKDGKVTITVYNYAMEKVKTLVKVARRKGGGSRSEDPNEDRWDGKDASGRYVSVGTYYIRVESSTGESGWGKAIAVHGRSP